MLPLYTNCLLKSDALAGGADLGCDDRALHMSTVSSMDVESSLVYFYPRLLALNPEETGLLDQVGCTMEKVRVSTCWRTDFNRYSLQASQRIPPGSRYLSLPGSQVSVQEIFLRILEESI